MEKFKRDLLEEGKILGERVNKIFERFSQINSEEELKELLDEGNNLKEEFEKHNSKLVSAKLTKAEEYIIRFNLYGVVDSEKVERFFDIRFDKIKKELGY